VNQESRRLCKVEELACKLGIQQTALQSFLQMRAASSGISKYGHLPFIVRKYNNMGYYFITCGSLAYHLGLFQKWNNHPSTISINTIKIDSAQTELSSLSDVVDSTTVSYQSTVQLPKEMEMF
jgi:hypothetical protein